jgi:hypothetical protein
MDMMGNMTEEFYCKCKQKSTCTECHESGIDFLTRFPAQAYSSAEGQGYSRYDTPQKRSHNDRIKHSALRKTPVYLPSIISILTSIQEFFPYLFRARFRIHIPLFRDSFCS